MRDAHLRPRTAVIGTHFFITQGTTIMSTTPSFSSRMSRGIEEALRSGALLLLLAGLSTGTLLAQTSAGKKLSGAVTPPRAVSIDRLAEQSDIVAVGRVERMESEWNADKSRIQTRVTLAVEQTIKGETPDASMTVLVAGGEIDGIGELYTHTVQFQKNEDVLVFASKDTKGNLRVTSGTDGKFLLEKDAKSGIKRVPNLGTVEELSARIKNTIKAQKTETKRN